MHNRESLLLVEKWDVYNINENINKNQNKEKIINVKNNNKPKISFSPYNTKNKDIDKKNNKPKIFSPYNTKNKDIDKKRVLLDNKKTSKEESQRGLINNFSMK